MKALLKIFNVYFLAAFLFVMSIGFVGDYVTKQCPAYITVLFIVLMICFAISAVVWLVSVIKNFDEIDRLL